MVKNDAPRTEKTLPKGVRNQQRPLSPQAVSQGRVPTTVEKLQQAGIPFPHVTAKAIEQRAESEKHVISSNKPVQPAQPTGKGYSMGTAHIHITGKLGRNPELSYTPTGKAVCKFSVAVDSYKGKDNDGSPLYATTWYNVDLWEQKAEYFNLRAKKGSTVVVHGDFLPRTYTKRDGGEGVSYDIKFATAEIVAGGVFSSSESTEDSELDDHPF